MVTLYLNPPGTLALMYIASYFVACIESSVYDCIMFALQHMKNFLKNSFHKMEGKFTAKREKL